MSDNVFLYGVTPVFHCLSQSNRKCFELLVKAKSKSPRVKEILSIARKKQILIKECDAHYLAKVAKSKLHQGLVLKCSELATGSLDDFLEETPASQKKLLVALDQLEDPQNVGAVIRSAAFLGAQGVITLKKNSAPLTPTVSKASAGALEYFPIIQVNNLSESLQRLKREGYSIVGSTLSEESISLNDSPKTDWMVLVLGNEGQGLRQLTQKRCDLLVHIPGQEHTESLNVSAAAAILIHHFVQ